MFLTTELLPLHWFYKLSLLQPCSEWVYACYFPIACANLMCLCHNWWFSYLYPVFLRQGPCLPDWVQTLHIQQWLWTLLRLQGMILHSGYEVPRDRTQHSLHGRQALYQTVSSPVLKVYITCFMIFDLSIMTIIVWGTLKFTERCASDCSINQSLHISFHLTPFSSMFILKPNIEIGFTTLRIFNCWSERVT